MKRRYAIISNILLLTWYFLAMIGVKAGGKYLVTPSLEDEWIFMLIPIITFMTYLLTKRVGRIIHAVWLFMWFVTQFLSHEWYTIFGSGFMGSKAAKIDYFKDCIQLVNSDKIYVPDVYHIILHILIVLAFVTTLCCKNQKAE